MDCDSLKKIDIPTNVKLIGQYAFDGCNNITSIGLPDGLSEIGENAFSGCRNLQNINIPQNVKKGQQLDFSQAGCPLPDYTLPMSSASGACRHGSLLRSARLIPPAGL